MTKDSLTVSVDAIVYYRVMNPEHAICQSEDYDKSTRLLASTTLRNILGTHTLTEILADRESITKVMSEKLDFGTDPWGVKARISKSYATILSGPKISFWYEALILSPLQFFIS